MLAAREHCHFPFPFFTPAKDVEHWLLLPFRNFEGIVEFDKEFCCGIDFHCLYEECGIGKPSLIVIGNESNGISPEAGSEVTDRLFIPPFPGDRRGSESLNAAVATAVTVAEFRRRQALNL